MENTYWFIPSRVGEAISALQDLGYVIAIEEFHSFADKYKSSNMLMYRTKTGLTHSVSTLDVCRKNNIHSTYVELLGPKVLIFTDEYKESQDSFAEVCNTTEYIT